MTIVRSHAGMSSAVLFTRRAAGLGRTVLLAACIPTAFILITAFTFITPSGALAEEPRPFWTRCAANAEVDIECSGPHGVATAPATAGAGIAGNVYVADSLNRRVVEFTVWGAFVKAWGWDVVQSGPGNAGTGFEICVPADGDICKVGTPGSGPGQFQLGSPQGVAIDSAGNIYVLDRGLPSNQRVQKFDSEGHFLLMWGKGVNTGTGANKDICTNAGPPEEACGQGGEGTGPGQFGELPVDGSSIAVDTAATAIADDDRVYVGDEGRIQRFNSDGEYQSEISLPGEKVKALAVDPAGNLYVSFCLTAICGIGEGAKASVRKLSPAGADLGTIAMIADPEALATGPDGELFVIDGASNPTIRQFSPAGTEVVEEETTFPFFPTFPFSPGLSGSTGIATGSACLGTGYDLYVANSRESPDGFIRAYGPPPDKAHIALCPPEPHAPEIEDQGAVSVETDRATVQAKINPKFWEDTSYFVQYATAECIKGELAVWAAPCVKQKPAPPGALLGAGVTDVGAQTAKVPLTGLTPETEYRYRFVAQSRFDRDGAEVNEKGGPIYGVGGTEALEGEAASFTTTASPPPPETGCPNQSLRSGASAFLPDCRAYEMVSPINKNGGDIRPGKAGGEAYIQASPDGNRITYSAIAAFGDESSNLISNQYLATREKGGWSNQGINVPLGRQLAFEAVPRQVGAFSPDLCSEWLADFNATPPVPEAAEGYANLYRQDLCGGGGLEALTRTPPLNGEVLYVGPDSVQGFSEDLGHVFAVAKAALSVDADSVEAASSTNFQIYEYDRSGGAPHLVSVGPDGTADPGVGNAGAEVGGGSAGSLGGILEHAVSEDGSRVFWTAGVSQAIGQVYLRENPSAEQSALVGDDECTEPSKACTVEVSSGQQAIFWGAAANGSEAIYSEGSIVSSGEGKATLHRFDVESKTRTPIAAGLMGVLGTSDDLSRIYFVSTEELTPEAQAGEPNLYLDDEGDMSFIATLLDGQGGDMLGGTGNAYSVGSVNPRYNTTRVTPDGGRIAFESRARLTGFDNVDANKGKADVEVFTYEVGGELLCVSCNPSGVRPSGRELPEPRNYPEQSFPTGVFAAAWIPALEHPLYTSNVLSEDGGRLFFMSYTPLVPRDTNSAQDVYEWEAPGEGGCSEKSAAFHELNGGCLYLISSGESPFESEFWDASPDGRDVFFSTESSLLPQDPGLIDIYDAREDGGFAQPSQAAICEGETCQSPPAPPNYSTPASSAYQGAGDPAKKKPTPCRKGKVRRKGRCVAKKQHKRAKQRRAANHNRGAER